MVLYDTATIRVPFQALIDLAFNEFGIFLIVYIASRLAIRHERGASN
jgi:hypothetical protein